MGVAGISVAGTDPAVTSPRAILGLGVTVEVSVVGSGASFCVDAIVEGTMVVLDGFSVHEDVIRQRSSIAVAIIGGTTRYTEW